MLKKDKTEEAIDSFVTFLSLVAFRLMLYNVPNLIPRCSLVRLITGVNFHVCIRDYVTYSYLSDLSMFLD